MNTSDKKRPADFLEKEIKFELDFYSYIAGTENYEVLCLPYDLSTGHEFSEEEIKQIAIDSKRRNIKLVYRVSMNNDIALVYTEDQYFIGMVPELDTRGFIVN